jgi:phosphate transport system substrate-binding protein
VNADLSYQPINAPGAASYPITSPTYIIAYVNQKKFNTGTALKQFLQFIYADGQGLAPSVGYAALPPSTVRKAIAQLNKFVIPAA